MTQIVKPNKVNERHYTKLLALQTKNSLGNFNLVSQLVSQLVKFVDKMFYSDMRKILVISFLLASAIAATAQAPQLSSTLSRDSILIGEQVEWSFKVTVAKPAEVYFAQVDSIGNGLIEVLKTTGPDTLKNNKTTLTVEQKLLLTSFDAASYTLPKIPVLVVKNSKADTLYFEPAALKVATVAIDTTTFKPHDIKPPVKYPYSFREIMWPWGVIVLLGLLLIAAIVYIILRVTKKQPVFGKPKPADPPHVIALRELGKIKSEKLWQNNKVKQYYTRVTDVLRIYLEQRYQIQAPEQTSDEILQALAQLPLPETFLPQLRDMLSVSDLVKFAKYVPATEENESVVNIVESFVQDTKEQKAEDAETKSVNS